MQIKRKSDNNWVAIKELGSTHVFRVKDGGEEFMVLSREKSCDCLKRGCYEDQVFYTSLTTGAVSYMAPYCKVIPVYGTFVEE